MRVSSQGGGGGAASPVAVRLQGPDLTVLNDLASQLQQTFGDTPGLVNVTNSAPVGQPQLVIQVDQARAADLGVSPTALGTAVRTAFAGVVTTKYQKADATLEDVRLELTSAARNDITQIGDLPIQTSTGQTVPLRSMATINQSDGPDPDQPLRPAARGDCRRRSRHGRHARPGQPRPSSGPFTNLPLPDGYTTSLGGNSQSQAESFGQLATALGASVLLAYLLMAVLYNSLLHPLVILFALPAAAGGAIVGLLVFGYNFSVFAMIGMILLVGLAIKNGILLVDRTNMNRMRGMDRMAALLEAGPGTPATDSHDQHHYCHRAIPDGAPLWRRRGVAGAAGCGGTWRCDLVDAADARAGARHVRADRRATHTAGRPVRRVGIDGEARSA